MKVIATGPPGSGFERMIDRIVTEYSLTHVSLTRVIKNEIKTGTREGRQLKKLVADKTPLHLFPAEVLASALSTRLQQADCVKHGWVLSGFPLTRAHAQAFQSTGILADKFLQFTVNDETIDELLKQEEEERILSNMDNDDTEGPLSIYNRNIDDVADIYSNILTSINADQVTSSIWEQVDKYLSAPAISLAPKRPLRLLLLGPVGSGKATQARKLSNKYGTVHVSVGALVRKEMEKSPDFKQQVQPFIAAGQLIPDDIISSLVTDRLKKEDCAKKGWVLDGFPRSLEQAKRLSQQKLFPNRFVLLRAETQDIINRLTARKIDPLTGKVYHSVNNPPSDFTVAARLAAYPESSQAIIMSKIGCYNGEVEQLKIFYGSVMKEFVSKEGVENVAHLFRDMELFLLSPLKESMAGYVEPQGVEVMETHM